MRLNLNVIVRFSTATMLFFVQMAAELGKKAPKMLVTAIAS